MSATGCNLTLSGSTISGNQFVGIWSNGGPVVISNSTIFKNEALGVVSTHSSLTITGSTIASNLKGGYDMGADEVG